MDRTSDRHGAKQDDELKHELDGALRGKKPTRVEEYRDPEPPAEDDPVVFGWDPRHEDEDPG